MAHPRACGENNLSPDPLPAATGSSPRVRGKRRGLRPQIRGRGLIPARAGKTRPGCRSCPSSAAHPRACGENLRIGWRPSPTRGSSPRVRGKQPQPRPPPSSDRLIPARAGKTGTRTAGSYPHAAHPRVCGENPLEDALTAVLAGSSPRVRGKPVARRPGRRRGRLIPARAGKTVAGVYLMYRRRAHPRACGENRFNTDALLRDDGSSPRVRGKRGSGRDADRGAGLIPARAGKTATAQSAPCPSGAHPRACGENPLEDLPKVAAVGSSPRVRGKRSRDVWAVVRTGLIPARAGKTCRSGWPRRASSAHPRACGENLHGGVVAVRRRGSSPRVRGKRRSRRGARAS